MVVGQAAEPSAGGILVVDDVQANLLAAQAVLAPLGERVVTASSGAEALKRVLEEDFSLIIMDARLPDLDGFETARLIHTRERSQHIPILFLTAISREQVDAIKAYAQGAVDYLVKPIDPGLMRAKVSRFLRLSRESERDRRLAEQRAYEQSERLRLVLEATQDHAIFMLDTRGVINTWPGGAQRLTGYSVEEAVGQSLSVLYPPSARERRDPERGLEVASREGRWVSDGWRVRKDGSRFWAQASISAMRGTSGQLLGYVKVMRDGTSAKQAEESLRLGQERLRLALAAADEGTWEWDLAQSTFRFDERCRTLFALAPGAEVRTPEELLPLLHPEDRERVSQAVVEATGAEGGGKLRVEFRLAQPGASERWLMALGQVLLDAARQPERMMGIVVDITDRHQVEDERARRERFRDQLIGILGHDLRNPLQAVKAVANLLERSESLEPRLRKAVGQLDNSAVRMERLIRDMLDMARSQLGQGLVVSPREMDLATVVGAVVQEMRTGHPERDLRFTVTGDARGSWDPDRVAQVASNLIGNALQYGPPDQPVQVTVRGEQGAAVLEVQNRGQPIPEGQLPSLFQPFTRGTEAGDQQGSVGLGLFIARQIVQAHKGTIEARSSADAGTVFSVRWPR